MRFTVSTTSRPLLSVTLRRFRTTRLKRFKYERQLIVPFALFSFRQLEIRLARRHPQRVKEKAYLLRLELTKQAIAPLSLITVSLAAVLFFGSGLHHAQGITPLHRSSQTVQPPPAPKSLPAAAPTFIRIPKIEVDTNIVTVGRNPDDTMQLPDGFWEVGWYKDGPTPGQLGPAILVGHLDQPNNIAVFWRLRELQAGDTVEIDRADGGTATFSVTDIKEFAQDNFPTQEVYGNLNYAGLRLITCGGEFNEATGHYSENLVVYARLL